MGLCIYDGDSTLKHDDFILYGLFLNPFWRSWRASIARRDESIATYTCVYACLGIRSKVLSKRREKTQTSNVYIDRSSDTMNLSIMLSRMGKKKTWCCAPCALCDADAMFEEQSGVGHCPSISGRRCDVMWWIFRHCNWDTTPVFCCFFAERGGLYGLETRCILLRKIFIIIVTMIVATVFKS